MAKCPQRSPEARYRSSLQQPCISGDPVDFGVGFFRADCRDIDSGRDGPASERDEETAPKIDRITRNARLLKAAAVASLRRTLRAFGHVVGELVEVLRPFPALEPDSPAVTSSSSKLPLRY